jgi:hypothetical protein
VGLTRLVLQYLSSSYLEQRQTEPYDPVPAEPCYLDQLFLCVMVLFTVSECTKPNCSSIDERKIGNICKSVVVAHSSACTEANHGSLDHANRCQRQDSNLSSVKCNCKK